MGTFKKKVRSEVRRAARLVLDKYYLAEKNEPIDKDFSNALVKELSSGVTSKIMATLRDDASVATIAAKHNIIIKKAK